MGLQCNLFVAFLLIGLSYAASSSNEIPFEKSSAKLKCESAYSLTCLKLDILSLIDKIATTNKEFNIASGVVLVREENPNKTQNSRIVSGNYQQRIIVLVQLTEFIIPQNLRELSPTAPKKD